MFSTRYSAVCTILVQSTTIDALFVFTKYCKNRNFSNFTIIAIVATSDLTIIAIVATSDLTIIATCNSDSKKLLLNVNTIFC